MRAWLARRLRDAARRLDPAEPPADPAEPPADPGDSPAAGLDIESLRLVHKEVKERSARLDAASARLDTKAATLLGFVSAACIFLATQNLAGWWKAMAYAAWAATVGYGLLAMRVRRWKEAPEPEPLQRLVAPRTEAAALTLITAAQVKAFAANRKTHERKATHWRYGLGSLVAAVLLTAAAITLGGNQNADKRQPAGPVGSSAPAAPTASVTTAGTVR